MECVVSAAVPSLRVGSNHNYADARVLLFDGIICMIYIYFRRPRRNRNVRRHHPSSTCCSECMASIKSKSIAREQPPGGVVF